MNDAAMMNTPAEPNLLEEGLKTVQDLVSGWSLPDLAVDLVAKDSVQSDDLLDVDGGAIGGAAAVAGIAALVLAGPLAGVAAAAWVVAASPDKDQMESDKLFQQLDVDHSRTASMEEIAHFVECNQKLWAMLAASLDQPPEIAMKVVTQVAMELATGLKGEAAFERELTKEQFHDFRKKYVLDPAGSQELFHRAIFATFDTDNNAVLDEDELCQFLEVFYAPGSPYCRHQRLPPKAKLQQLLLEKLDTKNEGHLPFEDVRRIIIGEATAVMYDEIAEAAEKAEAEENIKVQHREMVRLSAVAAAKADKKERLAMECAFGFQI